MEELKKWSERKDSKPLGQLRHFPRKVAIINMFSKLAKSPKLACTNLHTVFTHRRCQVLSGNFRSTAHQGDWLRKNRRWQQQAALWT